MSKGETSTYEIFFSRAARAGRPIGQALAICGLAVLLMVSCSKDAINHKIEGDWKLVAYSGSIMMVYTIYGTPQYLSLNHDHTYTLRFNDSLVSSGIYHVDNPIGTPRVSLYFSDRRYSDGYTAGWSGDSLVLVWRGAFLNSGRPVMKYVRR